MTKQLTYETFDQFRRLNFLMMMKQKGHLNVLKWAYSHYGDQLVYACSFGIEGIVLIDLISKVNEKAKVVFLDTSLHFNETYELIEKVKKRYPSLQIELKKPSLTLEEQAKQFGDELWKSQPNKCCEIRKILPLNEVLSGATAWLSGLRRDQSESRKNTQFINKDNRFKSIKICPLIHWSWKDIWRYSHKHNLITIHFMIMDIQVLAVNLVQHLPLMRMIYDLEDGVERIKMNVDFMDKNSIGAFFSPV